MGVATRKSLALLAFAVLASACGEGQIGPSGADYSDTSIGEPYSGEAEFGNADELGSEDDAVADPVISDPVISDPAISDPVINDPVIDDTLPADDTGANELPPQMPPAGDSDRPWEYNTGPKDLDALVPSGGVTLSSPGVYENLDVTGDIYITSSNVTVRNFRVDASGIQRGVWVESGLSNVVLEDGEIFGMTSIGIYGMGYTARRLHIHDSGGDALRPEGNPGAGPTLVEHCFVERMGLSPSAHADGLQVSNVSEGSYDVTLQYNNFHMPAPGTPEHPGDSSKASAVIFVERPVGNYVIQNNWLNGGGYTVYCGGNTADVLWRDNIFGDDFSYGPVTGTCQNWSGNVWEDTGEPL